MKTKNDDAWSPPARYIVATLMALGFVGLLIYAKEAVKALIVAAFAAYLINPAVTLLSQKTRLSRSASVNLVYFTALALLIGLPTGLTPIFFEEIKLIVKDLLELSQEASRALSRPVEFAGMRFEFDNLGESLAHAQDSLLRPLPEQALQLLETTSVQILWLLAILVSVYLFLSEWSVIREGIISLAPPEYQDEFRELYRRVRRVWMAYLRGQIVLMLIVGIVFTIAWFILGIPGALALGVAAGLFTLVPDVGPFVAAALAVGVALLEGSTAPYLADASHYWVAGLTAAVYLVLINLKNFFLRPYIMGRSVHMNEGLVFVAIIVATILEGIMGALLVVPVLASSVIIFDYLRRRVTGLPPFEGEEARFTARPEEIARPRRILLRKNNQGKQK